MPFRLIAAGDSTLIVELPARIDPETSGRAVAIAERIRAAGIAGVRDVVPTYHTAAVCFDPLVCDPARLELYIGGLAASAESPATSEGRLVDVPVCYDEDLGPDLVEVAAFAGCDPEEVIARHTGGVYRVYMLGFMPGFAYMGTVDRRIAMPRRATPRVRVPERSVAIANQQTGIYPIASPGGWRVLGRTPVAPFEPARPRPFLLEPGDTVRFTRITRPEYQTQLEAAGLHDA